jgi:N-sulfoglucosamine sulfohydrolase
MRNSIPSFSRKMNIIYIHSHDTGRCIQPYGYPVPAPSLQQLAEEGVLFTQCFCANPTCSASRSALLTGTCPHQNGMLGLAHLGFSLNDYRQHLLHTLKENGYHTALSGIQHIASDTADQKAWEVIGYDECLGSWENAHTQAVDFIERNHSKPFFLSVGFFETHRPFPDLDEHAEDPRYCMQPALFPNTPETRTDAARYKTSARILDEKTGTVLNALARTGLAENTLVICTTDHGIAFPNMKCRLIDAGTGVMLIMRGPNGFSGGKVFDSMVSHMDIFPTLCDLLGIAPPEHLQGKSLLPLIREKKERIHDELFAEVNYHVSYEPMRSVRTDRWKYIRRYTDRRKPVLPNCDDGETKSLWLQHGWEDSAVEEEMLYDLILDPMEQNNLAGDIKFRPALLDMRNRLNKWMKETGDPLLTGPVPAPEGAIVTDPDEKKS